MKKTMIDYIGKDIFPMIHDDNNVIAIAPDNKYPDKFVVADINTGLIVESYLDPEYEIKTNS